jgi:hypothetical protein
VSTLSGREGYRHRERREEVREEEKEHWYLFSFL